MTRLLSTPARLVTFAFALVVSCGTVLLMLPVSRTGTEPGDLMVAAFTTVSAACVTGLITVDTPTYWTPFGQGVILVLIHVGGLGVMTLATLLALTVRRQEDFSHAVPETVACEGDELVVSGATEDVERFSAL